MTHGFLRTSQPKFKPRIRCEQQRVSRWVHTCTASFANLFDGIRPSIRGARMSRLLIHRTSTTLFAVLSLSSRSTQAFAPLIPQLSTVLRSKFTSPLHMSKRVLVPIAEGSEEIETTCITDTLTRFGAQVTVASVMSGELLCKMSRNVYMKADTTIEDAIEEDWDLIVLPGGMPGAEHLRDSKPLIQLLEKQKSQGKLYGAICAAPAVALAPHGLIPDGATTTCYPAPGFRDKLKNVSEDDVVVSGTLTTSQGPGTALLFALQLGEHLYGKEKRDEIAKQMLVQIVRLI